MTTLSLSLIISTFPPAPSRLVRSRGSVDPPPCTTGTLVLVFPYGSGARSLLPTLLASATANAVSHARCFSRSWTPHAKPVAEHATGNGKSASAARDVRRSSAATNPHSTSQGQRRSPPDTTGSGTPEPEPPRQPRQSIIVQGRIGFARDTTTRGGQGRGSLTQHACSQHPAASGRRGVSRGSRCRSCSRRRRQRCPATRFGWTQ